MRRLLAGLAALVLTLVPALAGAQQVVSTPVVQRQSGLHSYTTSAPPPWMQVATSNYWPQSLAASSTTSMCRKAHWTRDAVTALKLGYATAYSDAATGNEIPLGTSVPLKAWVEYPAGTYAPVLFGGSSTPTLADDTDTLSDALAVTIPTNTEFWEWDYANARTTLVSATGGPSVLSSTAGEGCTVATSGVPTSPSGSVPVGTATQGFASVAVLAQTNVPSIAIIGNSRPFGVFNSTDAQANRGYDAQLFGPTNPYVNYGVPSSYINSFIGGSPSARHEFYWTQYETHFLDTAGYGDLTPTGGYRSRVRAMMSGKGYIAATYEGNTSSTDGWTTTTNQTNTATGLSFISQNQGIRASGLPYTDPADVTMTGRDTGIFLDNSTSDGLHTNVAGGAAVVADSRAQAWLAQILAVSTAVYAWAPVMASSSAVHTTTGQKFGGGYLSGGGYSAWGMTPPGGSWTIEVWAKQTTGLAATLVGNNTINISVTVAGVVTSASSGQSITGTGTNLLGGTWHHIALVSTKTGATLYFDGASVGTSASARALSESNPGRTFGVRGAGATTIGSITTGANAPGLDEVSVWSTAKTSTQIAADFAAGSPFAGTETGLVEVLHLDDATIVPGSP